MADSLSPNWWKSWWRPDNIKKHYPHQQTFGEDTANPSFLYEGRCLERLGDTVAAIAHYEKALHEAGILPMPSSGTANLAETEQSKTIAGL